MAERPARLRRLSRYLLSLPVLVAAIALALYALAGFYLAPYLVAREIPRFAAERLKANAAIAEIRVNPFLLTLELKGFQLQDGDNRRVFAFDRLFVDFEVVSLLRWSWTVAEVSLEGPRIDLDIDPAGELNLLKLANRLAPQDRRAPAKEEKEEPPPRLLLHHLGIARGRIALTDRSDPTPAQVQIEPITFDLKDLSTLPGHRGEHTVSARLAAGGALAWRGRLTLQPLGAEGEIKLKDLKLATLWRFLQDELRVEEPSGSIELAFHYGARIERGALQITGADISARAAGLSVKLRGSNAPLLALAEVALSGGSFDFAQRKLSFSELRLRQGELSAARDEAGALDWQGLIAPTTAGAPVQALASNAQPDARPWQIAIDAVRVEEFAVRATDATRVEPLDVAVGQLDAGFGLSIEHGARTDVTVDNLAAQLSRVSLAQRGVETPFITLDAVALEGGKIDAGARTVGLQALRLNGGQTVAVRQADGTLNLAQALAAKREEPPADAPFAVAIEMIELTGHRIGSTDQSFNPAFTYDLENFGLKAGNFSTTGGKPLRFEATAQLGHGGSANVAGTFDIQRNRAEGRLAISRLALPALEPLIASQITFKLASGSASAEGRFNWEMDRDRGHRLAYTGGARIDDLLVNDAAGERLAASQQIAASGMALDLRARRLSIEEIRCIGAAGKLAINKDRSTNLAALVRTPAASAPVPQDKPASEAEQKFRVNVERVRVESSELDFADLSLVLPFSTRILDLNGTLTGLDSEPGARASVKLEGRVEDYGLARADGTISLFEPKAHTDITVTFRNVAMPPLSPYSATFAGRRIASGRLSLDLQYKLNNGELQGENRVVLEQFTLGERVESPGALNLPLDLAIAILTDSDGKIDIAVPVRGNVDKPEFSYSHLVWQAIGNLLTRIVTAPFRALASLFGGSGENLDEIAFDAGSARLLPPEREKLARVADTLKKRPQLKLVVQGRYHAERDAASLRDVAARRALAERLGGKFAAGEDPGPVAYDNARTQRALEAMLAERGGAEALAQFVAGFEKRQGREARRVNPALALVGRASEDRELYEAMFRRIIELEPTSPKALEELARERGSAIAKQVAGAPGIGSERVGQQQPEAMSGTQVTSKLVLDVVKATP